MSEQFKSIETTELVKIANAIRTKTGTTDKISLEDMPAKIAAIEGGVALPELENEGSASDLLSGKQLINGEGNKVTGTFSIDSELNAQDSLIAQIQTALQGKAGGGSGGGDSIGTFTLRIYSESSMSAINCIWYISNNQPSTWEFDGLPTNEIVINNIDVNTYFIIDSGVFYGSQNIMIEDMSSNLINAFGDTIFYGTQPNTTETIKIMAY